jgi:hypothetical protein
VCTKEWMPQQPGTCCYGVFCPFAGCRNTHAHERKGVSQAVLFVTQHLPEAYVTLLDAFDRTFRGNQAVHTALTTYGDQSQRRYVQAPTLGFHRPRLVALALCAGTPSLHDKVGAFVQDADATRRNVHALRRADELKALHDVLAHAPLPPPLSPPLPPSAMPSRRECILCFDEIVTTCWVMVHAHEQDAHGSICDSCQPKALRTLNTCHVCDQPLRAKNPLFRVILL